MNEFIANIPFFLAIILIPGLLAWFGFYTKKVQRQDREKARQSQHQS